MICFVKSYLAASVAQVLGVQFFSSLSFFFQNIISLRIILFWSREKKVVFHYAKRRSDVIWWFDGGLVVVVVVFFVLALGMLTTSKYLRNVSAPLEARRLGFVLEAEMLR